MNPSPVNESHPIDHQDIPPLNEEPSQHAGELDRMAVAEAAHNPAPTTHQET